MSVIYVLLAISLVVAIIFFIAFIVSVKSGQYDDSYTPSVRMLFDDELVREKRKDPPVDQKGTKERTGLPTRKKTSIKKKTTQLNKQV